MSACSGNTDVVRARVSVTGAWSLIGPVRMSTNAIRTNVIGTPITVVAACYAVGLVRMGTGSSTVAYVIGAVVAVVAAGGSNRCVIRLTNT